MIYGRIYRPVYQRYAFTLSRRKREEKHTPRQKSSGLTSFSRRAVTYDSYDR